eukprot:2929884-Rhodomonas_salina.1
MQRQVEESWRAGQRGARNVRYTYTMHSQVEDTRRGEGNACGDGRGVIDQRLLEPRKVICEVTAGASSGFDAAQRHGEAADSGVTENGSANKSTRTPLCRKSTVFPE